MPTETRIEKSVLRLVTGNIADQDTDAVVTAAHWRLNKGAGTDGTIHTKGGPRIYEVHGALIVIQRRYALWSAAWSAALSQGTGGITSVCD